jgi:hypothetical protein
MLDSAALNVVISLVFIYLLYSLLVTIINEIIASLFRLRSKTLQKGIRRMLTDDGVTTNSLVDTFFNQPSIKFLGENNKGKKPAYLTAASFSKGFFDICREFSTNAPTALNRIQQGIAKIKTINPETGQYLESLLDDANYNVDEFRKLVELWFNETMDRATGWYKQQTQRITFIVGFIVALSFNADTIQIVKTLSLNPKLAEKMADNGAKYAEIHMNDYAVKAETAKANDSISDPMADMENYYKKAKELQETQIAQSNSLLGLGWDFDAPFDASKVPCSLLGFLITALAVSLGAPFWFDILNKVVQLRTSKKIEVKEPPTINANVDIEKKD